MKKSLSIALLLSISQLFAQTDFMWTIAQHKTWNIYSDAYLGNPYNFNIDSISYQSDTLIDTQAYKKYTEYRNTHDQTSGWSSQSLSYFLREDDTHKVFQWTANGEYLLYDYGLQLGDRYISYIMRDDTTNSVAFYWTISHIDSIASPAGFRTRFTLTYQKTVFPDLTEEIGPETFDYWIEGIGSLNGLLNTFLPGITGATRPQLLCVFENDAQIYHNSMVYEGLNSITQDFFQDECMSIPNNTKLVDASESSVRYSDGMLYIQTGSTIQTKFTLYNSLGVVLMEQKLNRNAQIDVRAWSKFGILLYQLDGKTIQTGKIILAQ